MPVNDWNRVDAGAFHAFHTAWITHLSETLNQGVLPEGYYAMPEKHAGRWIADVLTLQTQPHSSPDRREDVGVAVADAPPRVRQRLVSAPSPRLARRTLTIRHVSGHEIVALLEIVSPANKDRATHVQEFVDKIENAISIGIHVLLADLLPAGRFDPAGIHGAIWERISDEPASSVPDNEPLALASYIAGPQPEAYIERLAVGVPMVDMPLFLNANRYVNVPLESTYNQAFNGLPAIWRQVLD